MNADVSRRNLLKVASGLALGGTAFAGDEPQVRLNHVNDLGTANIYDYTKPASPTKLPSGWALTFKLRPKPGQGEQCEGCAEWIKELVISDTMDDAKDQREHLGLKDDAGVKGCCISSKNVTVYDGPTPRASLYYTLITKLQISGTEKIDPQEIWISKTPFNSGAGNDIRERMEKICGALLEKQVFCP
jgi:hypothetical protein